MGGADPPYEPSPRLYSPPPKEGGRVQGTTPLGAMGTTPQGADPKGQPFGGVSGVILPGWPP